MSTASEMKYVSWKDVEREHLNPQIDREMVVGDKIMLARVLMKKGAHVPLHHHHNEQVTYILEGALKFAIDGKEIVVHAGEVLCIPPHMPHEAQWAGGRTLSIWTSLFNPPREDWLNKTDDYPEAWALKAGAPSDPPHGATLPAPFSFYPASERT